MEVYSSFCSAASVQSGSGLLTWSCSAHSWRGGPEPVQHPGHGGDRAEQAGERPGLRGDPEAPQLRRGPRAEGHHAAAPQAVAAGDPEEAGGGAGAQEGEPASPPHSGNMIFSLDAS